MFIVNNLQISFNKRAKSRVLIKDISFSIKEGEFFGIVGESGSGKSLTALSIMKLLPSKFAITGGKILFNNKDITAFKENQMQVIRGNEISMIFQDPLLSLNPLHTIEKQIKEVLFLHNKISKQDSHDRCLELLELVGLSQLKERLNCYPHQLSGGQRQRIMIAMALANNPKLLIADEPTTALDIVIEKQIILLIKELQKKIGMSVLFITHNIDSISSVADDICVLKEGRIVESGKAKDILSNPKEEYTKLLLSSSTKNVKGKEPFGRELKPILKVKDLKVLFSLKKNFFGKSIKDFEAVKDVSFVLNEGETLGVLGESGSGKTTLLLALLRLQKSFGEIVFDNQSIRGFNKKSLRGFYKKVQIVFQDPFASLNPRMSIEQIIGEALNTHYSNLSNNQKTEKINYALQEVGLSIDIKERYPHEFSGGQRQRIAIARALILEPKVILLDEPTSALDFCSEKNILSLLENLQRSKKISYIIISHNLGVIKSISHRVIIMSKGEIVEVGNSKDVFKLPKNEYTKNFISKMY